MSDYACGEEGGELQYFSPYCKTFRKRGRKSDLFDCYGLLIFDEGRPHLLI